MMRWRLAAWVVTGPVGHLVAGVADWTLLFVRWHWARATRKAARGVSS